MSQPFGAPLPPPPPPAAAGQGLHPLSLGRIVEVTLRLLRYRWRTLLSAVVVPLVPVYVLAAVVQVPFVQAMNRWLLEVQASGGMSPDGVVQLPPGWAEILAVLLLVSIAVGVAGLLATAAVTHATGTLYSSDLGSARRSLLRGLRRLPVLLGAYVLYGLALLGVLLSGGVMSVVFFAGGQGGGLLPFLGLVVIVGAIALAVFLLVRWSLLTQAIMLEDMGLLAAFGRSWRLVSGSGWRVLGYLVVLSLLVGLLGALILTAGTLLTGSPEMATESGAILSQGLLSGAVSVLLTPILPIALTLLYFDLRWRRGEPTRS